MGIKNRGFYKRTREKNFLGRAAVCHVTREKDAL